MCFHSSEKAMAQVAEELGFFQYASISMSMLLCVVTWISSYFHQEKPKKHKRCCILTV